MVALFLILTIFANLSFSWNAEGHKIIMQIALDNLPKNRIKILKANEKHTKKPLKSLLDAAAWLDKLRGPRFHNVSAIHYIDLPYYPNGNYGGKPKIINHNNILNALIKIIDELNNPNFSKKNHAYKLRFLYHLVGDLHQPLHAAEQYSNLYPNGDRGGNLVPIEKSNIAYQLHQFWDKGGGFLYFESPVSEKKIKKLAKKIERKFPCQLANEQIKIQNWLMESHQIAITQAYPHLIWQNLSQYQRETYTTTQRRLAIAGCRLAKILLTSTGL
jgi:hypothetical protein